MTAAPAAPEPGDKAPDHVCRAKGCTVEVPFDMLMCRKHWFMVHKRIRERVWAFWREGNAKGHAYAVAEAVDCVAAREAELRKNPLKLRRRIP